MNFCYSKFAKIAMKDFQSVVRLFVDREEGNGEYRSSYTK
jgi:hypothetical protein